MTLGTSCPFISISGVWSKNLLDYRFSLSLSLPKSFMLKIIVTPFQLLGLKLFSCSPFFFSPPHSLVVSGACSVVTFRGLKSCQVWQVWSGEGLLISCVIAAKLFKWDSSSGRNCRFVLTGLFCSFMSRNPLGQIHHYFSVRIGQAIFHRWGGFQKSAHIKKPNSLLLATPNA